MIVNIQSYRSTVLLFSPLYKTQREREGTCAGATGANIYAEEDGAGGGGWDGVGCHLERD